MEQNYLTANELSPGEEAFVVDIYVQGPLRRRLFDLGLVPGAKLCRRYTAPAASPIAYDVQGMVLALRLGDAKKITVRKVEA